VLENSRPGGRAPTAVHLWLVRTVGFTVAVHEYGTSTVPTGRLDRVRRGQTDFAGRFGSINSAAFAVSSHTT
jgi:hypothetical protein